LILLKSTSIGLSINAERLLFLTIVRFFPSIRACCGKERFTIRQIFCQSSIVKMVLIIEVHMLLITGASGHIGRRVAELLAQKEYRLRLMTRNPETAQKLEGAEVVRGDFAEPATLDGAFAGVSAALVVSGSGHPGERAKLHRNAFEAAARAHVKHVVYLSLQGASPTSKYPFSRDHFQSEQYLAATGVPHTVLRDAFYMDMFLNKFDADGVMRGPANEARGAFISREDAARTAAAVLVHSPGGTHDVTGPEKLSLAEVAHYLSDITGRQLRYQPEAASATRERLSKGESGNGRAEESKIDLSVGWFEAIAAGELAQTSDAMFRFTGKQPMKLEEYFRLFPQLLHELQNAHEQESQG
jgi:NAD(P)H dehydrogenase (quinone)